MTSTCLLLLIKHLYATTRFSPTVANITSWLFKGYLVSFIWMFLEPQHNLWYSTSDLFVVQPITLKLSCSKQNHVLSHTVSEGQDSWSSLGGRSWLGNCHEVAATSVARVAVIWRHRWGWRSISQMLINYMAFCTRPHFLTHQVVLSIESLTCFHYMEPGLHQSEWSMEKSKQKLQSPLCLSLQCYTPWALLLFSFF